MRAHYCKQPDTVKYFATQRDKLGNQNNFTDVLSFFQVAVSVADLCEGKSAINMRPDPTLFDSAHDLACPTGHFLSFSPHVAEVQAKHAAVSIN